MTLYNWDEVEREQMNPLLARQCIHGGKVTVGRISLAKGCIVPEHRHVNEQVSMLASGRLRFDFSGRSVILEPGQAVLIAPNEPHAVEALEDSIAIDVFAPAREDWRTGDDAYLRR